MNNQTDTCWCYKNTHLVPYDSFKSPSTAEGMHEIFAPMFF